jgi:hypothetical protein
MLPKLLAHAELVQHPACQNAKAVPAPRSHLVYENASEANY